MSLLPIRIALAQVNPTLGDLPGNSKLIRTYAAHAKAAGAHVLAFPEMVLTGYPVEDLALRPSFRAASVERIAALALELAADGCGEILTIVGYLDQDNSLSDRLGRPSGAPVNAAAVIYRGEVLGRYIKHHLPNYGVFDEFRNFVPGDDPLVIRFHGVDIALAICEDLWQDGGPVSQVKEANVDLLVVINGSPYETEKDDVRLALCQRRAVEADCALAYVNMTGGQDELVFDGDSMVVDHDGALLARAPQFSDGLMITDLNFPTRIKDREPEIVISTESLAPFPSIASGIAARLEPLAEIWNALVVGLRDYVEKNHFNSVMFGLSGGIDSAVVAALALDALGADRVHAVSMPSVYSSQHSLDDAALLALNTGIHYRVVPIERMVGTFVEGLGLSGLAEENVQARVRGTTLMSLSNQEGHLILAPGNKSELAVGYSTIYGDAVGGFAPIKDVFKTLVWELARWRNAKAIATGQTPPIPLSSIEKEPSAELRPGQLDSDSLPPYPILDPILDAYVEGDRSAQQVALSGFDQALVERIYRMVDSAEYKRRQYPPGTKISKRAFGRDRRLPITSAWRERGGFSAEQG
ncbi:glutamine-dependent NAD(+) synthetase [mine drainage metagenome]|uniref:NAD(+) synthase (glutamine-hydrolyzing) n=1 Tax=mine drainage metagenome TaxID=410659 RepID=A0A1J5QTV2_9ZZZZ